MLGGQFVEILLVHCLNEEGMRTIRVVTGDVRGSVEGAGRFLGQRGEFGVRVARGTTSRRSQHRRFWAGGQALHAPTPSFLGPFLSRRPAGPSGGVYSDEPRTIAALIPGIITLTRLTNSFIHSLAESR